jgi:hypothetical protein
MQQPSIWRANRLKLPAWPERMLLFGSETIFWDFCAALSAGAHVALRYYINCQDEIMRDSCNHRQNSVGPVLDAIKIAHGNSGTRFNHVAYYVVKTAYVAKTAARSDKRSSQRRRTRLRSGKIVDPGSPFLIDCLIHDRSDTGARLRLFTGASIPAKFQLFEDMSERLIDAFIVWRRNREIGIRVAPFARRSKLAGTELALLRAGYNPAKKLPQAQA